jgi:large subunit ribosomal protein L9
VDIILLEKIDNVGGIGDKVTVKPGYGRNYLIPQGKATLATPENIAKFEARRAEIEAKAYTELEAAQARARQIEGQVVRVKANAGPEGKLFGSVGTSDIAEACEALGFNVSRSEIRLSEGPLRVVGEHQIELHFYTDVNASLTVIVEGEDGQVWVDPEEDAGSDDGAEIAATDDAEAADNPDA